MENDPKLLSDLKMTRLALEKSSAGTGKGGVRTFSESVDSWSAFKHVLAWRQKLAGKKKEEEEEEKGEGLLRIFSRHGIGQYDIFNRESHHFIA